MHEADQYRYDAALLNDYFERDMREREERDALVQAYREWGAEEGGLANPERDSEE
jgi:hypothetical protein